LQRTGVQRTAHSRCHERPVRYEAVSYVGEFEFAGEEGYTSANATRLPLLVRPLLDDACGGIETGELKLGGDGIVGAGLHIGSRGRSPDVRLSARKNGPNKTVEVFASIHEQRG